MLEDYTLVVTESSLHRSYWNVNSVDTKNWLPGMIANMYSASLNLASKFNEFKPHFTCCMVCG